MALGSGGVLWSRFLLVSWLREELGGKCPLPNLCRSNAIVISVQLPSIKTEDDGRAIGLQSGCPWLLYTKIEVEDSMSDIPNIKKQAQQLWVKHRIVAILENLLARRPAGGGHCLVRCG